MDIGEPHVRVDRSGSGCEVVQTFTAIAINVPAAIETTASRLLKNPPAISLFFRHFRRQRRWICSLSTGRL